MTTIVKKDKTKMLKDIRDGKWFMYRGYLYIKRRYSTDNSKNPYKPLFTAIWVTEDDIFLKNLPDDTEVVPVDVTITVED